jgi:uncharacterized protein (TIGR03067 family)
MLAALDGTWQAASQDKDGQLKKDPGDTRLTIAEGRFTFHREGKQMWAGTLAADADKGTLDFLNSYGGLLRRVRYKLDGDTLLICCGEGDDRPKEITAKKGTGNTVTTYRRKK